jgi:hypothetical protein
MGLHLILFFVDASSTPPAGGAISADYSAFQLRWQIFRIQTGWLAITNIRETTLRRGLKPWTHLNFAFK